jgi:hypothetical protein
MGEELWGQKILSKNNLRRKEWSRNWKGRIGAGADYLRKIWEFLNSNSYKFGCDPDSRAIVVPDGLDDRHRVGAAADLLQRTLKEAAGVSLPIIKEAQAKPETPTIYLGATKAAQQAGIPLPELKAWTFLKQVQGQNIFLAGDDSSFGIKENSECEYLGTQKAITSFLEDEGGVRFLLPGPNGIDIPKIKNLDVDAGLRVIRKSNFDYVIGRRAGDPAYMIANNFFMGFGVHSYGGHSYYAAVPAETYGASHPEYFALIGGVRTPAGNHLCISNPDVQELMLKQMAGFFDQGYAWEELAQTDGYRPCECEKCRALQAEAGERIWMVHKLLAEKIEKLYPGRKVMIISYGPTADPPKTFTKFPDNVVIQMCAYPPEAFDQWQPYNVEKTVYLYNWGEYHSLGYAPKRTPRYAAEQVQRFVLNKVRGIYTDGIFELLGLEGPVYYVYGKMMGDPALNYNDVLNDYYRTAFGNSRVPMKAFFTAMYDRLESFSVASHFAHPNFRMEKHVNVFRTPEDAFTHYFPPRLLADMEKNLERAKFLADDPRVQARLRLVELEFGYVKNLASVFHFYRAYRLKPDWTTFDLLATEIEKRNQIIDSWYDEKGNIKTFDGWPTFFGRAKKDKLKVNGYLQATLSAPFNWDTKTLRAKKILPGVGSKTMTIKQVDGVALDGSLNEPFWQAIKAEELNEIGMGTVVNPTLFKAAYDETGLYFGFECAVENVDKLNITPLGHDGGVWANECLEIFIDPFGQREKYYHFIFNPTANSFYEARAGFIEDPYHPLHNTWDASWNGKWEYAARVDPVNKKWTAEVKIPFATLGVAKPGKGTIWTLNVGREEYEYQPGQMSKLKLLELLLWSPNLEERSFHSRAALGNLVFE